MVSRNESKKVSGLYKYCIHRFQMTWKFQKEEITMSACGVYYAYYATQGA